MTFRYDSAKTEVKFQKILLNLHKRMFLPKQVYYRIRAVGSQFLRMYDLPKVHKGNVPLKTILTMVGSIQHELANWLAEVLDHVLQFYFEYCILHSFQFASDIRKLQRTANTEFLLFFLYIYL